MADLNLKPMRWKWDSVTTGDTYPAIRIQETSSDTAISAISLVVKDSDNTEALTLSNGSGITITTATAGAWDFTIDAISPVTLSAGVYYYELQITDDAGTIRTEFEGTWQILSS